MDFMTVTLYSPFMPQLYELMRSAAAASAAVVVDTADHLHQNPDFPIIVAAVCGVWYVFIVAVQTIGTIQLYRYYSTKPATPVSPTLDDKDVPHVTVLRPVKGLEPQLYECLVSTFRQTYPRNKLTIYFCVSSRDDASFPILEKLIVDFSHFFDVKLFVEDEDPNLGGLAGEHSNLGPNPKIRNMSRGYREVKGDIVWIVDCNVWVGKGVLGRMVDKLCGFRPNGQKAKSYKFVHQLPLVVDSLVASADEAGKGLLSNSNNSDDMQITSTSTAEYGYTHMPPEASASRRGLRMGGGRFEEMFMASSHAKFYTAINTVSVAPCIVGKSSMFRKSHLNYLTASASSPYSPGIDFFSENICEDHLIGDLLWRKKVPEEEQGEKWGKHQLVFGDLAIQPMAGMSVHEYIARRVRWLRVRKWTVTLATLIEPGVESFLCSAYGAFALTTLPLFSETLGIPRSWLAFFVLWFLGVVTWAAVDWVVYQKLQSGASIELDDDTPFFARPPPGGRRRNFKEWSLAWLGRETLAFPVWAWAVLGGTTVVWRGKKFWVGVDMKVHEIKTPNINDNVERDTTSAASSEHLHGQAVENAGPTSLLSRPRSRGKID